MASIKITIYRLASTSKIARILCRAAENGKEVVALMELRARFDLSLIHIFLPGQARILT